MGDPNILNMKVAVLLLLGLVALAAAKPAEKSATLTELEAMLNKLQVKKTEVTEKKVEKTDTEKEAKQAKLMEMMKKFEARKSPVHSAKKSALAKKVGTAALNSMMEEKTLDKFWGSGSGSGDDYSGSGGYGYWDQLIMWILYDECDGDWDCFYDYFGWYDSYSGYSGDWSGYSGDGSGYDYSGYDWSGYESGSGSGGGWWSWFWKAMEKKGANKSDMKALMDALKNRK